MKFLVVPLDRAAVSFCYYAVESGDSAPIPLDTLGRAVTYARSRDLTINFIFSGTEPPSSFAEIMGGVRHAKIVPLSLAASCPDAVVVLEADELEAGARLADGFSGNVILRFPIDKVDQLFGSLPTLMAKSRRINLCLLGLERASEADLDRYRVFLEDLVEVEESQLRGGNECELSFLTEMLLLDSLRDCNAGIDHLSVGPDGSLYLCPGFLHGHGGAVGNLMSGPSIPNARLLAIGHAPICSICDAYQCKRCVNLNNKLTLEINTPSRQLCVASHLERNASSALRSRIADVPVFSATRPILATDYLDPLEALLRRAEGSGVAPATGKSEGFESSEMIGLLKKISASQDEILRLLKGRVHDQG